MRGYREREERITRHHGRQRGLESTAKILGKDDEEGHCCRIEEMSIINIILTCDISEDVDNITQRMNYLRVHISPRSKFI